MGTGTSKGVEKRVCLFSMKISTLILTCFDLKNGEICWNQGFCVRNMKNLQFIAKKSKFLQDFTSPMGTHHHMPSKCQPQGGWFGGRETPELGGRFLDAFNNVQMLQDSDFAWPLSIKNANIRNHTSYIRTLIRFETLIVGCILEVKGVKCWTAWSETPHECIFGDVRSWLNVAPTF